MRQSFATQAPVYDSVAQVQAAVAQRLAARLSGSPARILEIGCGTGLLSAHLAAQFPAANLLLTDISPEMLAQAQAKLGGQADYRVMDGQHPDTALGKFDLIVSSLALQWFDDLPGGLARLAGLLAPGGVLAFATLGAGSFAAWRQAHEALGLDCGLRDYVDVADFPWPAGYAGRLDAEIIDEFHASGRDFAHGLKRLGAGLAPARHRPVGPGKFRALLQHFAGGFTARYQVLYGEIRPRSTT